MQQTLWKTEPDGVLTSEAGAFRLVVTSMDGWVRYLVLRPPDGGQACSQALLASGHAGDARSAMLAAERTAARLAGTQQAQHPHRRVS